MSELAFEYLLAALESARGTPAANPTHYLNLAGSITPKKERYRPPHSDGTLAEYRRSIDVRRWSEWEAEGALDVYTFPLIANTLICGGVDGSGATPATLTVDPEGDDNALDYEAVTGGSAGNTISVEYIDPGVAYSPLEVDVAGRAIRIYLATDVDGDITSTASDIAGAIAAHPVASTLVTVANHGMDNGSGPVTAMGATYLSGGAGASVITPPDAVLTRLWTFEPNMRADDLQAMTLWWGDPNVQAFRSAFCMPDELTISADASGTDGVTLSISGQGQFPTKTAPGAVPAPLSGPLLLPGALELWIDDTSAIGTTPITGRVVSAEVKIPLGGTRKWLAAGPANGLGFQALGRAKRHIDVTLVLEVPDLTQYDQWVAETVLKARVRFNGPAIETVGDPSVTYYHFVEVDVYGPFDGMDWGEHEGTNRTVELTTLSEYDESAGYDWCVRVQNDRNAL